jgi:hypothetical protein
VTEEVKITAGQHRRRCRCLDRNHSRHAPRRPAAPAVGGGRGAIGTVFGRRERPVLEKVGEKVEGCLFRVI